MADPVVEVPVIAPVVTPAPAAPAAAEAAPAPSTPAPVAVSAEAAPTPAPTPAPVAAPAAPSEPTSILSEAKPASIEPPTSPTPAEVVAPVTPPPFPTYEALKLPDGVSLDAARVTEFDKMMGQYQIDNNADLAKTQAFRQQLADFFVAEQQRSQAALVESFNTIRNGWKDEIKNDKDFGGQNMAASMAAAGALIEQYGGSPAEVAELRKMLRITGAGDNPYLYRLMARVGKALVKEGTPVPATVPKSPTTVSKTAKRYAASLNGSGT